MTIANDFSLTWDKAWPLCDQLVSVAVGRVYANITKSHSWKSKKYSFVSLFETFLDKVVTEFFERSIVNVGDKPISILLKEGAAQTTEWLEKALMLFGDGSEISYECFKHTVATLRDLVVYCANIKSRDSLIYAAQTDDESDGIVRKAAQRVKGKTKVAKMPWYLTQFSGLEPGMFCELCDQFTRHFVALENYYISEKIPMPRNIQNYGVDEKQYQIKGYSHRYCKNHNPDLNLNMYKSANRKRVAFSSLMCIKREGDKILHGRSTSIHKVIREAAYKVIQCTRYLDQLKLAENVVKKFYETIPDTSAEECLRKDEMLKAYIFYFGSEYEKKKKIISI